MDIKDINVNSLVIDSDKEGNGIYSRCIYKDSSGNFVKIWHDDFFYRQHFEESYSIGFFDDLSVIIDVITDGDKLLGYVTKGGSPVCWDNMDGHKYRDIRDRLIKASKLHNVFYLDFMPKNVVDIDGRYYLIDLEPSVSFNKLFEIPSIGPMMEHNDYLYRKAMDEVTGICKQKISVVRFGTNPNKPIVYGTANGRIYLENEYLPTLSGTTLFVGVNYYTDYYHLLTKNPEKFETLDILDAVITHGSPYKHYVCNILDFKSQGYMYDNVCFFGILGHLDEWDVLKNEVDAVATIKLLDSLVAPGGTLLLGPAANNFFGVDFWDGIYNELKEYEILMKKRIDINYIWYGRKG